MSRRRGEFEHRTSIFEGAFRAWSHLGGLLPEDLENKSTTDLDPLNFPLESDPRLGNKKGTITYPDGTTRREYPYEPLPRSGLAHPYVQAILSPWLGPDADSEAIQLGLTTLRTWWQHRRKGESGSATAALGTEKMKGVVEGYTRHFFTLAHCLVINDREQPPRTLHSKMKDLEKLRSKRNKKRAREEEAGKLVASALSTSPVADAAGDFDDGTSAGIRSDLMDSNLSPLERLHAAQRRQLAESGGIHAVIPGTAPDMTATPLINIKGKCMPGKVDLPDILEQVNHHATQLAHRGVVPLAISSSNANGQELDPEGQPQQPQEQKYGDPNLTPVVFVSGNGDIQISMAVNGITCAHCVKIVETVLKGCNGNKSPIDGLLDAAADRVLCSVLIKIDKASNAKRIAFESARNLAMVGYTAKTKEMSIVGDGADEKATLDLGALSTAFEVIANTDSEDVFDWTIMCTCPDNGVLRDDCAR
jgi:copper chaperone CopZ